MIRVRLASNRLGRAWAVTCDRHGHIGTRTQHQAALDLAHRHCRWRQVWIGTQRDYGLASP